MGRSSASGTRLHELRQPKPANAAFRQSRPPQSHGFSLGPEHPERAIRPACRENPPLGVIGRPRAPQRSGSRNRLGRPGPAEAAKGSAPRLIPLGPHRPHARSSAAGLLRERRTRVGKSRRACRTPAALPIAARGRRAVKGPENDLRAGSCADASARSAMRHRRRRRKGGGDVREPQGDDVAQAGRGHEAQEQRAARAADDPDGGVRGVHRRARLPGRPPMRASREASASTPPAR